MADDDKDDETPRTEGHEDSGSSGKETGEEGRGDGKRVRTRTINLRRFRTPRSNGGSSSSPRSC